MRLFSLVLLLGVVACDANDDDVVVPDPPADDGCVDGVCVLTGTLLEDLTLTPDVAWVLRGGVFLGDDETPVTMTIEPGTTVYGESSTDGMLVVRRGARLVADGTAAEPIVFTSSKNPGERGQGDWGGLILNGRAPLNSCDTGEEEVEGACEAFGEGGTGWYGGDVATDDSGVLRYVRVEFAGNLISPDNELNGIAFQGVGSGTTVDYVQVHQNADDGLEFFGGTVQVKHVLVTGVGDDSIDWTDGWSGSLQYAAIQQYPGTGDNGIEADNNADNNDAEPRSTPALANITLVGVPESDKSDLGLLLREGTAGVLTHVLAVGFNEACLDVDHDATFATDLELRNSRLGCATGFVEDDGEPSVQAWFEGGANNVAEEVALANPYDVAAPDFRPTAVVEAAFDVVDPRLETATHVGAFDGSTDWTAGWTTTAAN